ncbi:MAG: DNA primase, partial [Mangrovimonas sp.]|nr:DNA primase [Mangrovimonas sp.]
LRECSRIMDISEEVLFSTLAQLSRKDFQELNKQYTQEQKAFEVIKPEKRAPKVDVQYQLERKIIEILLLYGHKTEDFEDLVLKENDLGDLELEPVVQSARVFEKVYLDLQEDEMMFTNDLFKSLFYTIIDTLHQNPDESVESLVNSVSPELASEMTSILMEDEQYHLHKWENKNIYPKEKEITLSQLVTETILSLRCFLIDQKVKEYQTETLESKNEVNKDILEEVKNYSSLKMLLSRRLNRAL